MDSSLLGRQCARLGGNQSRRGRSILKVKRIGDDLAKQAFQTHGLDSYEQANCRKSLKHAQMLGFFRNVDACLVAMEACGGSHCWARELIKLGHEGRLIAPRFAKRHVQRGKTPRWGVSVAS